VTAARSRGGALSRFLAVDGFFMSAGLAFFFLVSLIPILLLGVSLVGFVLSGEDAARQVVAQLAQQFPVYQKQIVANAVRLAGALTSKGFRLVSGGTDNHLMLVDVFSKGITGKLAESALHDAGITVNKNAIPFDQNPPLVASGVRIGTPAVTTRGMKEPEMEIIADLITRALKTPEDSRALSMVRAEVEALCQKFPLYPA